MAAFAPVTGLPPLPKCLRGILKLTNNQWKEMSTLHAMRTLIQQDVGGAGAGPSAGAEAWERRPAGGGGGGGSGGGSLDVPVSRLQREMVSLRQLDMSLLCQLWSLNESLQEYKHMLQSSYDRTETNSECSSYSLDNTNDPDLIPSIDEADVEEDDDNMADFDVSDGPIDEQVYENVTVPLRSTDDYVETSHIYTNTSFSPSITRYNSLPGHRHSWQDNNISKVSYC